MLYKLKEELGDNITNFQKANAELKEAYELLTVAKNMINDGQWKGKGQIIGKQLCEICDEYHKRIIENVEKESEALIFLKDQADTYMKDGKIPSEWRPDRW